MKCSATVSNNLELAKQFAKCSGNLKAKVVVREHTNTDAAVQKLE